MSKAGRGQRHGREARPDASGSWRCRTRAPSARRTSILNDYQPKIEVDSQTYEVRADGELLRCEPATRAAAGAAVLLVPGDSGFYRRAGRGQASFRKTRNGASPSIFMIKINLKLDRSLDHPRAVPQAQLPFGERSKSRLAGAPRQWRRGGAVPANAARCCAMATCCSPTMAASSQVEAASETVSTVHTDRRRDAGARQLSPRQPARGAADRQPAGCVISTITCSTTCCAASASTCVSIEVAVRTGGGAYVAAAHHAHAHHQHG